MAGLRTLNTGHIHTIVTHSIQPRKGRHGMPRRATWVALGNRVNTRGYRRQEGVVIPVFKE